MKPEPSPDEKERQIAEFSIGRDGARYHYHGYRYDRWQDAVAYASLMRDRPWQADAGGSFVPGRIPVPVTAADKVLMDSLGIRFDAGVYRFGKFRYDELSDAVNYARREPPRLAG